MGQTVPQSLSLFGLSVRNDRHLFPILNLMMESHQICETSDLATNFFASDSRRNFRPVSAPYKIDICYRICWSSTSLEAMFLNTPNSE